MKILEPIKVRDITFKNRVMFPPLTTGYEERDGSIGEQSFNFYKRLAQGGVGYIVIGDVAPVNTVSPTPKLFADEQIKTFKKLADACHKEGCKLGIQIFYPEYDVDALASLFAQGKMQEARMKLHHDMQHFINEVPATKLMQILTSMGECAFRAQAAGVDCIEIHGDRLVGSLCSTIINERTDEYGGSFENRTKFALALVKELKTKAPNMIIDYKLPIITEYEKGLRGKGGLELEEAKKLAAILEAAGVDMIHVGQANHTGNMGDTIPAMGTQPYGFTVEHAEAIKKVVSIPISCVGRIVTPEAAEALVSSGKVDMIGLGRSLLTDPDFVAKCERGESKYVRTCIMCNKGCTDAIQNRAFLSCVLNAENGYEYKRDITPTTNKKNVAVVGAGIAGLEAARVVAIKGHDVSLFDKAYKIGGQINIACIPPRKDEMQRAITYYEAILPSLKIKMHLGYEVDVNLLNTFDEVIFATGASNYMVPIKGYDLAHVISAWDILSQKSIVFGKVAVLGGGLVGAETAEYLANQGAKVSIIEMLDGVAKEESNTILPTLMESFAAKEVELYVNTKVEEIKMDYVLCTQTTIVDTQETKKTIKIDADFVVMALGAKQNKFNIEGINANCHFVGDCEGERASDINHAITSAYDVANNL